MNAKVDSADPWEHAILETATLMTTRSTREMGMLRLSYIPAAKLINVVVRLIDLNE